MDIKNHHGLLNGAFLSEDLVNSNKIMNILTQVPIGTKFKVKETGEIVTLDEIRNFPTRYKTINELGDINYYKTFEVEVVESADKLK